MRIAIAGFWLAAAAVYAQEPIDVGLRRRLFIDERFVASKQGVEFRMHSAAR